MLLAGPVAVAAVLTIVGIDALNSRSPAAGTGASATADPITVKAQSIMARFTTDSHPPAAAAFLTTTYAAYAASRPDTTGMEGTPLPTDVVILVEIEGYFPASHGCGFALVGCHDTGILVAFDQTLDQTLEVTYEDDPWSRDRPSPAPSVSERFAILRSFGTPVTLELPI
jgi:hypothetical protein